MEASAGDNDGTVRGSYSAESSACTTPHIDQAVSPPVSAVSSIIISKEDLPEIDVSDTSSRDNANISNPSITSEELNISNSSLMDSNIELEYGAESNANTPVESVVVQKKTKLRCYKCKVRVGLTAIKCRCGEIFCGMHRYSDIHECTFDYKKLGREEIQKANPVVSAQKIVEV